MVGNMYPVSHKVLLDKLLYKLLVDPTIPLQLLGTATFTPGK